MSEALRASGAPLAYLGAAILLFLGLKSLVKVRTAGRGRPLVALGLALALLGGVFEMGIEGVTGSALDVLPIAGIGALVGAVLALRRPTSPVPARASWIPAFAGGASALVAAGTLLGAASPSTERLVALVLAVALGAVALLVGIVLSFKTRETARATATAAAVVLLAGWATAALGFALQNAILLIMGGVAGTAGVALGRIVAAAAGQSLPALLVGAESSAERSGYSSIRSAGTEEAAMMLENAGHVVLVPGFGMAAAHAQHAVKEMAELLEKRGTKVTWLIHPSAGCVPGHMNIVLDEADVRHDRVVELGGAAPILAEADAAVLVGANDVVNPAALADPKSPVYGMEIPDLSRVRSIFVVKRSLRPGAAGVKNALFEQSNTTFIFGDAKRVAQALVAELKGAAH